MKAAWRSWGLEKLLPPADRFSENPTEVLRLIPRIFWISDIKGAIRGGYSSFMWKTPSLNRRGLCVCTDGKIISYIYSLQSEVSSVLLIRKCRWTSLLKMKCPSCGNNELQHHHRFCYRCGCRTDEKPLEEAVSTATTLLGNSSQLTTSQVTSSPTAGELCIAVPLLICTILVRRSWQF